jgi:hypothetical protein
MRKVVALAIAVLIGTSMSIWARSGGTPDPASASAVLASPYDFLPGTPVHNFPVMTIGEIF